MNKALTDFLLQEKLGKHSNPHQEKEQEILYLENIVDLNSDYR